MGSYRATYIHQGASRGSPVVVHQCLYLIFSLHLGLVASIFQYRMNMLCQHCFVLCGLVGAAQSEDAETHNSEDY